MREVLTIKPLYHKDYIRASLLPPLQHALGIPEPQVNLVKSIGRKRDFHRLNALDVRGEKYEIALGKEEYRRKLLENDVRKLAVKHAS